MRHIRQFAALVFQTAVEIHRRPVCLLLTVVCLLLISLVPILSMFNFGEDGKIARDSGLALHFLFGTFLAAYAASSTLADELRTGTAATVLSKPVGRDMFFLAKFTGTLVVVAVFSACAACTTLLAERVAERYSSDPGVSGYVTDWRTGFLLLAIWPVSLAAAAFVNFRFRRSFGSTAFHILCFLLLTLLAAAGLWNRGGHWAPYDPRVAWRILPASFLVTVALGILTAVAFAFSTRLRTVPTLVATTGFFLAALMSEYLFGRLASELWVCRVLYMLVPDFQHLWVCDALARGGTIPGSYVAAATGYGVLYTCGVLAAGVWLFRSADLKWQT